MIDKPSKPAKKPLDYPEQTHGSRVAARGRKKANAMTEEEREGNFKQAWLRFMAERFPKRLALDTNVRFDLADNKEFAVAFREVFQARGYELLGQPPARH